MGEQVELIALGVATSLGVAAGTVMHSVEAQEDSTDRARATPAVGVSPVCRLEEVGALVAAEAEALEVVEGAGDLHMSEEERTGALN